MKNMDFERHVYNAALESALIFLHDQDIFYGVWSMGVNDESDRRYRYRNDPAFRGRVQILANLIVRRMQLAIDIANEWRGAYELLTLLEE